MTKISQNEWIPFPRSKFATNRHPRFQTLPIFVGTKSLLVQRNEKYSNRVEKKYWQNPYSNYIVTSLQYILILNMYVTYAYAYDYNKSVNPKYV